jgi:hypothetical protein
MAALLVGVSAMPANAMICNPAGTVCVDDAPDWTSYSESGPGGAGLGGDTAAGRSNIEWGIPGMSAAEAAGRGGGGAGGGTGATAPVGPGATYRNPGKGAPLPPPTLKTTTGAAIRFEKALSQTKNIVKWNGNNPVLTGRSFTFSGSVVNPIQDLLAWTFAVTGSQFSYCDVTGPRSFDCTYARPIENSTGEVPAQKDAWTRLLPISDWKVGDQYIPTCLGTMVDGGAGQETVLAIDDLNCDASPETMPTTVRIDRFSTDPDAGIPSVDANGAIHFQPTAAISGRYTWLELTAVSPDGVESWPFVVGIRNHFAPAIVVGAAPELEGIVGMTSTVDPKAWFEDLDVDKYHDLTGDSLRYEVVANGRDVHATPRSDGSLDVRVIDAATGPQEDSITIRAVDSYGLKSQTLTIPVHVTDVVPGCENASTVTQADETVEVHFTCRLNAPAEYHQLTPIKYSIAKQPEFGTLSGLDTAAGVVTYSPDPTHPGPVTFEFTADNNGAQRTTLATVNVLPLS